MEASVLGIREVTWKCAGEFESEGYKVIYLGEGRHERGLGTFLDPDTKKFFKAI